MVFFHSTETKLLLIHKLGIGITRNPSFSSQRFIAIFVLANGDNENMHCWAHEIRESFEIIFVNIFLAKKITPSKITIEGSFSSGSFKAWRKMWTHSFTFLQSSSSITLCTGWSPNTSPLSINSFICLPNLESINCEILSVELL